MLLQDGSVGYVFEELQEINIPNSVTSIGFYAFSGCTCLTNITIPSVESIGSYAFSDCSNRTYLGERNLTSNIKKIELPETVLEIGEYAFSEYDFASLENISMPSVKRIGIYAFSDCSSLTNITIEEFIGGWNLNENFIEAYAFRNCSSLTDVTIIAEDYSRGIASTAFSSCSNLTNINVMANRYLAYAGHLYGSPWGATNATVIWNYTGE